MEAAAFRQILDSSDAVSYLDMAHSAMQGHWSALINGYWSPLYPALLTLWLAVFRPSPHWVILCTHLLTVAIFVATLFCFRYFLHSLLNYQRGLPVRPDSRHVPEGYLTVLGYALFFWTTFYLPPPFCDRPDVLVVPFVLLAGAALLRIASPGGSHRHFVLLGCALGAGYLSKAVMFPLAFVFLFGVLLIGRGRRMIAGLAISVICFLAIAAPYIGALSKAKGHLTYGEAGRINYAEFVGGARPFANWQGGPQGVGVPLHPTRQVLVSPPVYEYATPIYGTYPPWTDPSYWYQGISPRINLRRQLDLIHRGLDAYFGLFFGGLSCVLCALLFLIFVDNPLRAYLRGLLPLAFLWLAPLAAFMLYDLVHVETRFLGGFLILLFAATFCTAQIPSTVAGKTAAKGICWAAALILCAQIGWVILHGALRLATVHDFVDWDVSVALHRMGVLDGDRVAAIGDVKAIHVWAYLAGVEIVSEVPEEGVAEFWAGSPEIRARVFDKFTQAGARAVVVENVPAPQAGEWSPVPGTDYFIHILPHSSARKDSN
ncbi:MAG TPA: hypothetical protein VMJ93_18070 [Verrucomicrobiae bacterium]|nr:hypothetical protein [Verrucomicrobiae bacterium]